MMKATHIVAAGPPEYIHRIDRRQCDLIVEFVLEMMDEKEFIGVRGNRRKGGIEMLAIRPGKCQCQVCLQFLLVQKTDCFMRTALLTPWRCREYAAIA